MKLWIDDIRNAPDDSWIVARTVTGAIRALAMFSEQITEVSLDHDISHQVTMDELSRPYPCEETFQPVAHYLALQHRESFEEINEKREKVARFNPKITIHSSNPVGSAEMKAILTVVGLACERRPMGAANRLEMEV